MTDPVIPPEAVEAVAREIHVITSMGLKWEQLTPPTQALIRDVAKLALAAALPHLRPLVEARWAQMYSDAVDNGNELAQELRQDLKVATQVGLELGRQEAAEQIAQAVEADAVYDTAARYHFARIARDVATRAADARTDPSGHTDLPPTPDALSNRLPEEAP